MVESFYFCAHSSNHSCNENVLVVNWQCFFNWTFQWIMPGLLHFLVRSYQSQLSSLFTFMKNVNLVVIIFFPLFLKRDQTRCEFILKINKHDSWLWSLRPKNQVTKILCVSSGVWFVPILTVEFQIRGYKYNSFKSFLLI